jgi:ribosomal protein L11 methyltransferase
VAWQQLTLSIPAHDLPRTESLLELAGAVAITISDDGDTEILEPAPGTTPLWPDLVVRALFAGDVDPGRIEAALIGTGSGSPRFERIDDDAVAAAARQQIEPIDIGPRLAIVSPDDSALADERTLRLNMGLAFGTGRHPTTRLCLEWIEKSAVAGARVLDYGCGSGVLALAALKLGAREAVAIDNEPQALAATRRNARLNDLEQRMTIGLPDMKPSGPFDLVFANILARPLFDLAETFAHAQPPDARIVLSGLLESQLDDTEQHYRHWYRAFDRHSRDGWGLLTGTRRNEYDR